MKRLIFILTSGLWAACASSAPGSPSVSAELNPREISLAQAARLTIEVSGGDSRAKPSIPQVDGLRFQSSGQSRQIRIVNGRMSSSLNFNYHVSAERAGEFEIPAIGIRSGGQTLHTDPITLKVIASSSATPKVLTNPGSTPNPSTLPTIPAPDKIAFLRLERAAKSDRKDLFVGEMTPIAIRAYFLEGVQVNLNAKPVLSGSAYTLHGLSDQPEQQTTSINGRRYRVLTWNAGLSGVKAGDHPVKATLDATLGIPQKHSPQRSRSPFGNSPFDDPFFDSVFDDFFARVEQREVTLSSEQIPVTVQALPTEGRPANFDGAVGRFEIKSFSIPTELKTGDPETLRVTVGGRGNFDRLSVPHLQPAEGWKIYDASAEFKPADRIGFEARKSFEVPAIALQPGKREVRFSLAYFDPEAGEYRSTESDTVPITVTGIPAAANSAGSSSHSPAADSPAQTAEVLAPFREHPGRIVGFTPLYRRPWFIVVQGAVFVTLMTGLGFTLLRRYRERNPAAVSRRATRRAVATQLRHLETARLRHDPARFFEAARRALQLELGGRWHCNPEAITAEEIANRLPGECAAARVFAMADTVEFSRVEPHPDTLHDWQEQLRTALADLDVLEPASQTPSCPHWGEVTQAA